ncbi:MAG: 4Fe-4S binding protein [Patescibacteria group bacterium]
MAENKKISKNQQWPKGAVIDKPGSTSEYKTGSWRNQIPILDKKKCKNCLLCANFCPENCIKIKEGKISHIDYAYCKGCGICAHECPNKAIVMKKV